MRKRLFYWELSGFFFIFFLGSAWHFLYDWTDIFLISLAAPANSSVWEHLKIGVYPALLFYLLVYFIIGKYRRSYWTVRALQLYLIPVFTALLFYGYTAVLGTNKLFLDILIFAAAVAFAQFIGYKLLLGPTKPGRANFIAILAILVLLIAFAVLTVHPLSLPIFME